MPTLPVLSEAEYLSIEEAISATDKGRAFLRRRDHIGRVIGTDAVGQMVRGLQDWIAGIDSAPERDSLTLIRAELSEVRFYIDRVKSEITALAADEPNQGSRFLGATAELDEIVNATAQATNDILGAAEAINDLAVRSLPEATEARGAITARCIDIFQACSFQDITGQRVAKVVKMLGHVEERIIAMLSIDHGGASPNIASDATAEARAKSGARSGTMSDDDLLAGPQLPGCGLDQGAIDALLDGVSEEAPDPAPMMDAPAAAGPMAQRAIDALFP